MTSMRHLLFLLLLWLGSGAASAQFLAPLTQPQPLFINQLLTTAVPQRSGNAAGAVPTFSRATPATVTDFEGKVTPVLSGEIRFQGARRVRNYVTTNSENCVTGWNYNNASGATGISDPLGGTGAGRVTTSAAASARTYNLGAGPGVGTVGRVSVWLRADVPFTASIAVGDDSTVLNQTNISVTGTWQRFTVLATTATGTGLNVLVYLNDNTNSNVAAGRTLDIFRCQMENVTGQTNQNPSEYVSVGVASSPHYHGAMVDGVKYFSTFNGNTVASNVVTEATGAKIGLVKNQRGYLSGASGDYLSTPSATANKITGSIDLRADVALTDWTPSGANVLISKDEQGATTRSYDLAVGTTGALSYSYSNDGTNLLTATSSAVNTFTDGTRHYVRATHNTSTGAVNFYTSDDGGATWTALGTQQTLTVGTIYDSSVTVKISSNSAGGTSNRFAGRIFRAQVYNGINGTLAVDFNPNDWTSGSTFASSTTGETWTLNGNAKINNFPLLGYLNEQGVTNISDRSETFDNAAWTQSSATITADQAIAPDGTLTADKLNNTSGPAYGSVNRTLTVSNATAYTTSVFGKAAATGVLSLEFRGSGSTPDAVFNLYTCTVTSGTGVARPYGNGWCRCSITKTSVDTSEIVIIGQGATAAANDNIYIWGAMVEAATLVSSYIPTVASTVARNSDLLTYPSSGNWTILSAHSVYAEAKLDGIVTSGTYQAAMGGDTNYTAIYVTQGAASNDPRYASNTSATGSSVTYSDANKQTLTKYAGRFDGTNVTAFAAGTAGTPAAVGTRPSEATKVQMGTQGNSSNNLYGTVRNVMIYPAANDPSYLRAQTSAR